MNFVEAQTRLIETAREASELQREFSRAAAHLHQVMERAKTMQASIRGFADEAAAKAQSEDAWKRIAAEASAVASDIDVLAGAIGRLRIDPERAPE